VTVRLEDPLAPGLAAKVKVCVADGAAVVVDGVVFEVVAGLFSVPPEAVTGETEGVARMGVLDGLEVVVGLDTDGDDVDAVPIKAEPIAAVAIDAEPNDADPVDAVPIEAEPIDVVPVDAALVDAVPIEAALVDVVPVDAVFVETVPKDAELVDAVFTVPVDVVVPVNAAPLDEVLTNGGKAASVVVVDEEVAMPLLLVELILVLVLLKLCVCTLILCVPLLK